MDASCLRASSCIWCVYMIVRMCMCVCLCVCIHVLLANSMLFVFVFEAKTYKLRAAKTCARKPSTCTITRL